MALQSGKLVLANLQRSARGGATIGRTQRSLGASQGSHYGGSEMYARVRSARLSKVSLAVLVALLFCALALSACGGGSSSSSTAEAEPTTSEPTEETSEET